ncbi:MAG: DUF5655 domain-containing protein [Micromonosporaceae bacterium]
MFAHVYDKLLPHLCSAYGRSACGIIVGMGRWTCPRCDREFGRAHQSHVCVPGGTVEESFAGRPPVQREIYDALMAHLDTLGPVHVDAVKVGVFLRRTDKIAEVRPMARALKLWLGLPRRVDSPLVTQHLQGAAGRVWHAIRLTSPDQVDDELQAWLTEAYHAAA